MAWYDSAVFYHIYPLGLCGCAKENTGKTEHHFDKLKEWADHAKEYNFTAIYIGPLFESVGHGYETTDYRKVDCRLGTNEEFKDYVAYCHKIGLHVIVDGVFNHVGRKFFAFADVQKNRQQSAYCGWFQNLNFGGNNEYNDGFSYDNWGGYNLLVKLNQKNPDVKNYLYDVIRFWVKEFDIDGIRLDAADVLDFDFMRGMRHLANEIKPEFWLMGEVIHGDYSRWVNDDMLHSVTNYELHKGLYSGHNDHNYFEIAHSVKRLNDLCQNRLLYTFLDNHDVSRIVSKLNNKAHLPLVTMLLYTLYGIPSVYYGSEFGVEGNKEKSSDWNLRPCLNLSDFAGDDPTAILCKKLGQLKKDYRELSEGEYRQLFLTNRQFAFGRVTGNTAVVTALNCDDGETILEFDASVCPAGAKDLLDGAKQMSYNGGHLRITLAPNSGTVIFLGDVENEQKVPQKTEEQGVDTAREKEPDSAPSTPNHISSTRPKTGQEGKIATNIWMEGMGLTVQNMEDMKTFYCDVMGFAVCCEQNKNNVVLKRDNVVLRLRERGEFECNTSQKYQYAQGFDGQGELAFAVENEQAVESAFRELTALGARSVLPPSKMQWGEKLCYVSDPEGNLIKVSCVWY